MVLRRIEVIETDRAKDWAYLAIYSCEDDGCTNVNMSLTALEQVTHDHFDDGFHNFVSRYVPLDIVWKGPQR